MASEIVEHSAMSDNARLVPVIAEPAVDPPFEIAIDELDPVSARQAALAALGQKSIVATDIPGLAMQAARLAATVCQADGYGVAQPLPHGEGLLFHFGQPVSNASSGEVIEYELTPNARESLNAFALSEGKSVTVVDLANDTRYLDRALLRQNVTSAVVCPLLHLNGPLGTLGIYTTNRHDFGSADIFFLESVANLVAISFARCTAEDIVAQQSRRLDALLQSSGTPTLELTPLGRIKQLNPALEQMAGFRYDEVKDRSIYSAFVLPEELEAVQQALAQVRQSDDCVRFESFLLTKSGARRRLIWSFNRVTDEEDAVTALIGTAVDISEQHEMSERLKRTEAMADNAVQSLRALRARAKDDDCTIDGQTASRLAAADRRRLDRRPFPYMQCLAPMVGSRLPTVDMFREVRCHDLSSRGFSFHSNVIPDYQQLLVAFGKQGSLIHVKAEIVHVTPVGPDGHEYYLVGCRYLGRADYDS